jgi:hypothetical protein
MPSGYSTKGDALISPEGRQVTYPGGKPYGTPLQQWKPEQASRPTQRYLRSAGWHDRTYKPLDQQLDSRFQSDSKSEMAQHSYTLSPWQMDQAELSFGIERPSNPVRLMGPSAVTARYTEEAMGELNEAQMDAVRFNDILLPAVQADRALQRPEDGDSQYDDQVAEMFGTEGGSEMYAPNTMNALQQLGMGRLRGQDLDEYLTLDRAFDIEEIAALQPWDETPTFDRYQSAGRSASAPVQQALDMRQADLAGQLVQTAMEAGAPGWDNNSRILNFLNLPMPPQEQIPFGYIGADGIRTGATDQETAELTAKEQFYGGWWQHFTDKGMENLDDFWLSADNYEFTDADVQEFFDYIYNRTFDQDRMTIDDPNIRTGTEIRQWLGMGA